MPYQKFHPIKQWGRYNTRIFKTIYASRIKRKLNPFVIPEAVRQLGVEIYDPNSPDFPHPRPVSKSELDHPAFRVPPVTEHPLYNAVECELFDGSIPFTDGIDQACALAKAVKRTGLPPFVLKNAAKMAQIGDFEKKLSELILRGERYDPSLEKLPRRFDPVLFWIPHKRMHGTPVLKRGNIILENLFRQTVLTALQADQLHCLRYDLDEPLSSAINIEGRSKTLVVRSQPHLIIQSSSPIQQCADSKLIEDTRRDSVPDVTPIDPRIDLSSDHIYNKSVVLPRLGFPLYLDTIMWAREQDQKYPWTREQNAANAIMHCFGAAVAEAMRQNVEEGSILKKPIVTRAVQLVKGMMDFVIFQLNTLDLTCKNNDVKNIVWIDHAQKLYKPGLHDENYDVVVDMNSETFYKMSGLLLTR